MTAEGLSVAAQDPPAKAAEARRARLPTWVPITTIVVILTAKLIYSIVAPPNEDEAYYWAWGQHLALSYFDHAPLHGWMQGLAGMLLGWSNFSMRATSFLTLAGIALIFWDWAKRLAPGDAGNFFWTSLAIYLACPLVFAISSLAFPDHWLIFLSLASAHFFALFLMERLDGRQGAYLNLYVGAALLGLAALAKYNAVTLGVAIAAFIVFDRRLRPLLRDVNLYLAALLSVAMLTPMLIWNAGNGFASFRWQLYERYAPGGPGTMGDFSLSRFGGFLLFSIIYALPTLIPPLIAFFLKPGGTGFRGALTGLGRWAFVISSLVIGAISFFTRGAPHWNVLAFVIFLPLAAMHFRWRWLLAAHYVLGTILILIVAGYFSSFPIFTSTPMGDREAARIYGWDQVVDRMEALQREHDAAAIASVFYGGASKLAFAAGPGANVTALTRTHDSFDEWRDDAALRGKNIIIHDEWRAADNLEEQFDELTHLEDITVTRLGKPIIVYSLWLGKGYRGLPAP